MDNASKALLLAGAILMAIAVIGIGMVIFNKSQNMANESTAPMDALIVSSHNSKFKQYIPDKGIKGSLITSLAGEVAAYNAVATNHSLQVTIRVEDPNGNMTPIVGPGLDKPSFYITDADDNYFDVVDYSQVYMADVVYTADGIIQQINYSKKN